MLKIESNVNDGLAMQAQVIVWLAHEEVVEEGDNGHQQPGGGGDLAGVTHPLPFTGDHVHQNMIHTSLFAG